MKKHKKWLIAVCVVLGVLAIGCGGFLLFKTINNHQSSEKYNDLASSYVNGVRGAENSGADTKEGGGGSGGDGSQGASGSRSAANAVPAEPNPVDFPALQKQENDEIYSWITIPNTEVDYPVLQSKSNDYFYLDHGVDKEYRFAGAIYSQFCNKKDYSDRVTVLYGHNMADNSMFASLHSFEDPDFFAANKDMTIYTADKRLNYEIVSAFVYDDSHIMNSYDFTKDDVYRSFLNNVLSPHSIESNVRAGATLNVNDRIVILSTCVNYGEGRWLVVGKLTGETPLAPQDSPLLNR